MICKDKKIIFVSNSLGDGGAQRVLGILATNLVQCGYNIKVVSINKSAKEYEHDDLDILYICNTGESISKFKRIKLLRKIFKEERPDIIISFEYFLNMDTIVAARGLKIKTIVSERNDPAQQKNRIIVNNLRDLLYRKADWLVCQTPDAKAYFSKKVQAHTVIIPNPIKENLPIYTGHQSKTIINFCRLQKQKNLPLLIDAFELLHNEFNDYNLAIYGDGTEKENLEHYIKSKHLEDCVHIYPNTNDIHEIVSKCKMFVSSSDYEGLSNSMLEAMAMGMPVVCTDCPCGGARMMIKNGENGLLVPVGDAEAIYKAMKDVITDDNLLNSISKVAILIREELNSAVIAEQWMSVLEN